MDLVEFLQARLDEDEAVAKVAKEVSDRDWCPGGPDLDTVFADRADPVVTADAVDQATARAVVSHIARHDPARVLREVEAKRRILEHIQWADSDEDNYVIAHDSGYVFRSLALPYSDHPDYWDEWKP